MTIEVRGDATPQSLEQQEQIIEAALERKDQERRNWGIVLLIAGDFLLNKRGSIDVTFRGIRDVARILHLDDVSSWDFQQVSRLRRAVIQTLEEIEG